jgi:hypothetical protein
MPFPKIIFNVSTGSDLASGAGPTVAITGTSAAHTGGATQNTITLTNNPNLSSVPTDGSAALFIDTLAGRAYSRILNVNNTSKTVTVEDNFTITSGSARNYAIGGKLAHFANSWRVFYDAKGGWIIETETDQIISAGIVLGGSGTDSNGPITLRGKTFLKTLGLTLEQGTKWIIENLQFSRLSTMTGGNVGVVEIEVCIRNCKITPVGISTENSDSNSKFIIRLIDCEIGPCTEHGIWSVSNWSHVWLQGCWIHDCGSHGILSNLNEGVTMINCLITSNNSNGVQIAPKSSGSKIRIINCTFDGNRQSGLYLTGTAVTPMIYNNIFSNNGEYGIRTTSALQVNFPDLFDHNAFFNNTSGARLNAPIGANDTTLDPQYSNREGLNYSIGTNLKAKGYPPATRFIGANQSATKSYIDMGVAQRREKIVGIQSVNQFALSVPVFSADSNPVLIATSGGLMDTSTKRIAQVFQVPKTGLIESIEFYSGSVVPAALYKESFNKANSSTLGPDLTWTKLDGDMEVLSNRCRFVNATGSNFPGFAIAKINATMPSSDMAVEVEMYDVSGTVRIMARGDGSLGTCYAASRGLTTRKIEVIINGSVSTLVSETSLSSPNSGSTLKLTVKGSTIRLYEDGILRLSTTNSTISSGLTCGIGLEGSGTTVDNFSASNLNGVPAGGTSNISLKKLDTDGNPLSVIASRPTNLSSISANSWNRSGTIPVWSINAESSPDWRAVTWSAELGIFVRIKNNGAATSSNGITWTNRSVPSGDWESIVWSPQLGLFVAVAIGGTNRVMTSTNGISWTARTAAENNSWQGLVWSPQLGLFAAVATNGTNRVMTSPDGITWTARSAPSSTWYSITWSPELGLFVAVALAGTNRVMTSTNGITWTARSAPDGAWRSITWSPELGLFVAITAFQPQSMTSQDGITWISRLVPQKQWHNVIWTSELRLFVAVAFSSTISDLPEHEATMISSDGIMWTIVSAPRSRWISVIWSPNLNLLLAVGDGSMTASGSRFVKRGDVVAAVWEYESFESGNQLALGYVTSTTHGFMGNYSFRSEFNGTSWAKLPRSTEMALRYIDGTYEVPQGCLSQSGNSTIFFNASSIPNERGLVFKVGKSIRVSGVWLMADISEAIGLVEIRLYDKNSNILRTSTIDTDVQTTDFSNYYQRNFINPIVLNSNDTYRLSIKPISNTNVGIFESIFASTEIRAAALPNILTWNATARTGGGNWTDTETKKPWMGLLIDGIIGTNMIPPTLSISGANSVNEGSVYSLTLGLPTSSSVTSYKVDWGDGTSNVFTHHGVKTHTYSDGPTKPIITVDLTDSTGTYLAVAGKRITVNNVPPTIALSGADSVARNTTYTLTLGTITDPGQDTVTIWKIYWGDGTSNGYASGGAKTHVYSTSGTRTITVELTDEDGIHPNAGSKTINVT